MTTMTLCMGVDVHRDELVVRAVDKTDGHEVLARFRVSNNLPGCHTVLMTLAQTAVQRGFTRLAIGWEATGLRHKFMNACVSLADGAKRAQRHALYWREPSSRFLSPTKAAGEASSVTPQDSGLSFNPQGTETLC